MKNRPRHLTFSSFNDSPLTDADVIERGFTLADFYNYREPDKDILRKTELFRVCDDVWRSKGWFIHGAERVDSQGVRVKLKYRSEIREFISFGSNDYPALAADPRVREAAKAAIDVYGIGSTGSAASTGQSHEHHLLNTLLANMFKKQSSLLFNSGYIVNATVFASLARPGDLLLYDQLCHSSIQDGVAFAVAKGAHAIAFKHNDCNDMRRLLEEHRSNHNGVLLISEGIFSMDGYVCDVKGIVALAKEYNCRTFLDCAHDMGVLGETGLGAAEYHDCIADIDILMGTFSKCAGAIGGFIVGDHALTQYLYSVCRGTVFSVSLPPAICAAVRTALEIFQADPEILHKTKQNIAYFANGLREIGFSIQTDHKSTIFPVIVGQEMMEIMAPVLFEAGIWVVPAYYPVVSRNSARFRFTVTAGHSRTDLDYCLAAIKKARDMALNEIDSVTS